jgi:hypothetical protein
MLRRQSTIKHNQPMWYDTMLDAVKHTIIISEILDTRTRHLIQVRIAHVKDTNAHENKWRHIVQVSTGDEVNYSACV